MAGVCALHSALPFKYAFEPFIFRKWAAIDIN